MKGLEFRGYFPGLVGKVIELHAVYYHENWGFDWTFETQVGLELSDFVRGFQPDRDGMWAAALHGGFAGFIAIDGRPHGPDGARLRWFIVEPKFQGKGIGRALIGEAMKFCDSAGHSSVHLWTFEGLDVARALYVENGFKLVEEHHVHQWGRYIKEQKFLRVGV